MSNFGSTYQKEGSEATVTYIDIEKIEGKFLKYLSKAFTIHNLVLFPANTISKVQSEIKVRGSKMEFSLKDPILNASK